MEKISCTTVKVPSMHWKQKKTFFFYILKIKATADVNRQMQR